MGEKTYTTTDYDGREYIFRFSDSVDDWLCLCTFPHNDQHELSPSRVQSLALLGAAVALVARGLIEREPNDQYFSLPDAVPQWIRDEIKRLIPDSEG